ncbi:MAG: ATPase, T2SS/T4P/T4SS family [Candidatus Thorarchaeota archaeon]
MSKRDVFVFRCPRDRCKECPDFTLSRCSKLVFLRDDSFSRAVILEPDRNLIHIGNLADSFPVEPPWHSDCWESVYVHDYTKLLDSEKSLVEVYVVGSYLSLFYNDANENGFLHQTHPLVKSPLEYELLNELSDNTHRQTQSLPGNRVELSDRLRRVSHCVSDSIMETFPEISDMTRTRISDAVAGRTSVLGPLLPLLLDDEIEEVYVDRPGTHAYFDHRRFGRCQSSFKLRHNDVERLVTLIRAESNLSLDRRNPSLKTDLRLFDVALRLAISIPPLSHDGVHLEIRRAKKSPFSILDLIRNETLGSEAAAILLLAVGSRFNITITGGPGTGKTTLLNALDMSTPSMWRKVYIEDAIESRFVSDHHQVRIRVDPVDETSKRFDKTAEIVKSLHRSPDYLILGEIQTREHSEALFQAIAAGLRTMQTCHSYSAASLVSRWTAGHRIEATSMALMDLIVTMERPIPGKSYRRVSSIVEVRKAIIDGFLRFFGLHTVYSCRSSNEVKWSDDGAFLFHSREVGLDSHVPAFEAIVGCIREEMDSSLGNAKLPLGDRLWERGHPMRFLGV